MSRRREPIRTRFLRAGSGGPARRLHYLAGGLLAALLAVHATAQTAGKAPTARPGSPVAQTAPSIGQTANQAAQGTPATTAALKDQIPAPTSEDSKEPRTSDRRKAAKLYLAASKLYIESRFEEAMKGFEQAADLDRTNKNYPLAAEVARNHAVTALVQAAAKSRLAGDSAGARAALARALELDPKNFTAQQHLAEMADDAVRGQATPLYEETQGVTSEPLELAPGKALRSFHLRGDRRQQIQQVFQAYGVTPMLDDSVRTLPVRLDLDDAGFEDAMRVLSLVTKTFYVPLDAHRVVVAADTRENRDKFTRLDVETIYLTGLSDSELTEVETLAKNVFGVQQAKALTSSRTLTLRAPGRTLKVFNETLKNLLDGQNQVLLDVQMIQVAHTHSRNTGAHIPQGVTAFNVYAEEQSILNANQKLVNEIISSGLAPANDPLAILAILIASGQVSNSLLSGGFISFGGGITQSAIVPGSTTFNLSLNTSDSRTLDQIQLHLQDNEEGTIKEGEKYPIQTSSYSSLSSNSSLIAGLNSAGTSSTLSSLLSSLSNSSLNVPMVQYEDLGLTLKTTPRVLRNGDVALSADMKLNALSGEMIGGNPVLNNRAYSGVAIVKEGEATVIATEVDKSMSRAISGTPGISEIPGMNELTGKDNEQNYATLVIVMTPHVIRGPQAAGHTVMMRVEKGTR